MNHYHIRWANSKTDWQAFQTKDEAVAEAERLKRLEEDYKIEEHDGNCDRCLRHNPFAREKVRLETPKLIIEWDGETPTSAMCGACRAIFPTVEWKEPEANSRLLESFFEKHVKAEHSDQPPPWENAQGNPQ